MQFTQWLAAQEGRTDAVGDLAQSYLLDEDAPPAATVTDVAMRCIAVGAEPAYLQALAQAAAEYRTAQACNLLTPH